VSISFQESDGGYNRSKVDVKDLEKGKEISVIVPRIEPDAGRFAASGELESSKYIEHEFEVHDNMSALIIEVSPGLDVDIELYVKKGDVPNLSKNVYDYNVTLSVGELTPGVRVRVDNSSNSTGPSHHSYEYFLSNEDLNWTAAGTYFALVRSKEPKNHSFTEEELKKIPYNFSVILSSCWYYDEESEVWSTEGVKVIYSVQSVISNLSTDRNTFLVNLVLIVWRYIKFLSSLINNYIMSSRFLCVIVDEACIMLSNFFDRWGRRQVSVLLNA